MNKLVSKFKLSQQRRNSSVFQETSNVEQRSTNHLKWLALSANSISFLPVFLASEATDSEVTRRASSAEILSPVQLNNLIKSATRTSEMPASPFITLDPCDSHLTTDPFRATMLWEKIVIHLERTVKSGRHTLGLRTFDNCFHGSKAVDSLVVYLNTILPKTIKRNQAIVLCEKLLETGVIEQVKEKHEFREKGLYRFTHSHFWTPSGTSGSCDSDEHAESHTVEAALKRSRSMDMKLDDSRDLSITCTPEQPMNLRHPIPKGYASDSTVTLSTHKQKKRKTRKLSVSRKEESVSPPLSRRLKRSELSLLAKSKMQSVTRLFQVDRVKSSTFRVPSRPARKKATLPQSPKVHSTGDERRFSVSGEQILSHHRRDMDYTTTKVQKTIPRSKSRRDEDRPGRKISHEGYLQAVREKENDCRRESVHAAAVGACRQQSQRHKKSKQKPKLRERDLSSQNCMHYGHLNGADLCTSNGVLILNSATMNRSHSFSSHGDLHERCRVVNDQQEQSQVHDRSSRVNGQWTVYGFL